MKTLRVVLVAFVALGAAAVADGQDDNQVAAELKKLEGTWEVTYYEVDGVAKPIDRFGKLTFKGRNFSWSSGGTGTIADIDPSKTPKWITYKNNNLNGITQDVGIYEVDGDKLRDCFGRVDRPTSFATRPGSGTSLMVYQRVGARKDVSSSAPAGPTGSKTPWAWILGAAGALVCAGFLAVVAVALAVIIWRRPGERRT